MALLTRSQVAQRLGVSIEWVRKLTTAGKLRAKVVGVHPRYEEAEVEALRVERGGAPARRATVDPSEIDLVLKAFALFGRRASLPAIVAELRLTPAKVRALYAEYTTPLGHAPKKYVPPNYDAEREAWIADFEREQAAKRLEADREHQRKLKGI